MSLGVIPGLRDLAPEQALRRLELTIVRRLDGLLQGDYLGLLPGPGSEPAEAREYAAGDDVRRMDFGTGRVEKRDLAVAAVAAVGFLTERAGNRVGAYILHGLKPRHVPARTGRAHMFGLLRTLLNSPRSAPGGIRPGRSVGAGRLGECSIARGADLLRRTVGRRGLVVIVSDFLEDAPLWERQLRLLANRHQVLAVEIVDPRELSLPDVGLLTVVDPETGRSRDVQTADPRLRARYAAVAAEHRTSTEQALRRAGAGRLLLRTDGDWVRDIVRHVVEQRVLAQRRVATGGRG